MTFDHHNYLTIQRSPVSHQRRREQARADNERKKQMQSHKTPIYLKALTLRDVSDISSIREDIKKHMIVILRVTPLAQKDVEDLRKVVEELYSYSQSIGGDIARLGEERIVITPPGVKIWRGAYDLK